MHRVFPVLFFLLAGCAAPTPVMLPASPGEPPAPLAQELRVDYQGHLSRGVFLPSGPIASVTLADSGPPSYTRVNATNVDHWDMDMTLTWQASNPSMGRLELEAGAYTDQGGPCAMYGDARIAVVGTSPIRLQGTVQADGKGVGLCLRVQVAQVDAPDRSAGAQTEQDFRLVGWASAHPF